MASIKENKDSYTATRELSIDIQWDESHYPGDDSTYDCSVTFPVPHIPGGTVKMTYSGGYQSEVMEQITRDIVAYLDDPGEWTETIIKKGAEQTLKLRQLEKDLEQAQRDQQRYAQYAEQETARIQRIEQEMAQHKAKHGL